MLTKKKECITNYSFSVLYNYSGYIQIHKQVMLQAAGAVIMQLVWFSLVLYLSTNAL